jgi:hypothetical protein
MNNWMALFSLETALFQSRDRKGAGSVVECSQDCITCDFEVGHASACRRATARHLRDRVISHRGKSQASTAIDGCRIVESATEERASCTCLDKLKHVLPKSAETSLGAADMSVRATSKSESCGTPRFMGGQVGQAILPAAAFQAAFRTSSGQPFQTKMFLWSGSSQRWLPHKTPHIDS